VPTHRPFLVVALVGSLCGGIGLAASAVAQVMSPTAGPQQMVPYDAPATYPSTYPSTASSAADVPVLPPYQSGPLTRLASAADGLAEPSLSSDAGVLQSPYGYSSPNAMAASQPLDVNSYVERSLASDEPWTWQILPNGLMYKSYLAGNREPRMGSQWVSLRDLGWRWDATLGGRVGLVRYGTENDFWPQGWQLDVEGAAFPRLDLEHLRDLDTVDFRAGIPLTTRQGPWEFKFGYYHLSSHLGDEYVLRNIGCSRINYVRESLVSGLAVYLNPSVRVYSEVGYAFYVDGGAEPWEFQFGVDASPVEPTGWRGAPFFAINAHLRQENDFSGNLTVQTGWQWRGRDGHLCRIGMQYFNGMSDQYQFYNRFEEQIGVGLWYDY
jgi:hypothetical protein